jgi:hypothetical protein
MKNKMNQQIQISPKKEGGYLQVHTMQEGRLRKHLTDSEADTIKAVKNAIIEAHRVMGLNVSQVGVAAAASDVIEFVLKDYRLAYFDDLIKAIQWGSFGKLSSNNELTIVSARNVFQWYEKLRKDFPHELKKPMLPAPKVILPEPTPEQKVNLTIQAFEIFLNGNKQVKNERALFYYDSLIEKGLFLLPSSEVKLAKYREVVNKILQQKPTDWFLEPRKRQACKDYQFQIDENQGNDLTKFPKDWNNLLHIFAVNRAKELLILEFIEKSDKTKLLAEFKEYFK